MSSYLNYIMLTELQYVKVIMHYINIIALCNADKMVLH